MADRTFDDIAEDNALAKTDEQRLKFTREYAALVLNERIEALAAERCATTAEFVAWMDRWLDLQAELPNTPAQEHLLAQCRERNGSLRAGL